MEAKYTKNSQRRPHVILLRMGPINAAKNGHKYKAAAGRTECKKRPKAITPAIVMVAAFELTFKKLGPIVDAQPVLVRKLLINRQSPVEECVEDLLAVAHKTHLHINR